MEWMGYEGKSTVKDIRKRFDADVERFSNLETGQSATIDVVLAMELITRADPPVPDIGCGQPPGVNLWF